MNEIKTCENVKPMCSCITDDQIRTALHTLYTKKASRHTGHLCVEYDAIHDELHVRQYVSSEKHSSIEKDGKVWNCPHVYSIAESDRVDMLIVKTWGILNDDHTVKDHWLPQFTPFDKDGKVDNYIRLQSLLDYEGIPYEIVKKTRECIEASLEAKN